MFCLFLVPDLSFPLRASFHNFAYLATPAPPTSPVGFILVRLSKKGLCIKHADVTKQINNQTICYFITPDSHPS